MAEQYSTQIDANALEDWLVELFEISRATQFVLNVSIQLETVSELRAMAGTLRIIASVLHGCVQTGHQRYLPCRVREATD
jgi:hypothetical protein